MAKLNNPLDLFAAIEKSRWDDSDEPVLGHIPAKLVIRDGVLFVPGDVGDADQVAAVVDEVVDNDWFN
jgi:hypothetical protein